MSDDYARAVPQQLHGGGIPESSLGRVNDRHLPVWRHADEVDLTIVWPCSNVHQVRVFADRVSACDRTGENSGLLMIRDPVWRLGGIELGQMNK